MYSDQPTRPSSVVIFRKELTRQPASQCRSSIFVIFTECSRAAGRHHAPPRRTGSTPRIEAKGRSSVTRRTRWIREGRHGFGAPLRTHSALCVKWFVLDVDAFHT